MLVMHCTRTKRRYLLDIFFFVLVGHRDVPAVGFQVDGLDVTELLIVDGEGLVQDIGDIVIQHPRQILMILFVHTFHICDIHFLAEHHLVESTDEERVQEPSMENSQAHYSADELEIIEMFWVDAGMWIDL